VEKGFEKIILQFTTDFENTLLFKGVGGDPMLLNNPHFQLPYKKATIPLNVLLYNMFNLKAPLFKGGWGGIRCY
jgi:hypothetical protein